MTGNLKRIPSAKAPPLPARFFLCRFFFCQVIPLLGHSLPSLFQENPGIGYPADLC